MGAECNRKNSEYKKMHALPESNSVKLTSGRTDVARFGKADLEATENFSKTTR